MGSILRNNRRMFWEILNRIMGRKKRIIGTGLPPRRLGMRNGTHRQQLYSCVRGGGGGSGAKNRVVQRIGDEKKCSIALL